MSGHQNLIFRDLLKGCSLGEPKSCCQIGPNLILNRAVGKTTCPDYVHGVLLAGIQSNAGACRVGNHTNNDTYVHVGVLIEVKCNVRATFGRGTSVLDGWRLGGIDELV